MTTPSVISVTQFQDDGNGPLTINKPGGAVTGDTLVLIHTGHGNTSPAMTGDAAWVEEGAQAGNADQYGKVWSHPVTAGSAASWNFPHGTGSDTVAHLFLLRDADSAAINVASTFHTPTIAAGASSPTITPTGTEDLLICSVSESPSPGGAFSATVPSGMAAAGTVEQVTGGFQAQKAATENLTSGSATGAKAWSSITPITNDGITWSITVKSAGPPPPTSAPMRTVTRFISIGARRMASVITVAAGFETIGGATSPAAAEATATGTADNVQALVSVNAVEATATGAVDNATISTSFSAQAITATATGDADNLQALVTVNAIEATATGTANDATVVTGTSVAAIEATATGVAETPAVSTTTSVAAIEATSTAAAEAITAKVASEIQAAAATGVADNATAITAAVANAIEATGTGDGQPVTAKVAPEVQAATATGDALAVHTVPQTATATGDGQQVQNINITSGIQSADATGSAEQPTIITGTLAFPQLASATGDAEQVTVTVRVNPQDIAATGTAEQPTVVTGTQANAIEATGTGAAETPQAKIAPNAEHAASTAVAEQPQAAAASAEPQATGAAFDVTRITVASGIQSATATGDGLDATITVGGATSVTPTTATGTGDGQAITPIVGSTPQLSSATVVAHDGQASIGVTAELITALAIAFDAEFSTGQIVSIPLLTYIFSNILTTVVDTEDTTATRSNELVMGVGV